MKKKLLFWVVFAALTVNSYSQNAFTYLQDSLVNVLTLSTVAQLDNFDYKGSTAVLGTYLEAGETISMIGDYTADVEYLMLSAPHNLDCDIDLKVYQGRGTSGTVIARDLRTEAICSVRFTPSTSGPYTLELINSSLRPVFVSIVTLQTQRNPDFTLIAMAEALDITLGLAEQLSSVLPGGAKIPANKWTLFGGNVSQGSFTGYFNNRLVSGDYLLVGAGEKTSKDIDNEVLEQRAYGQTEGNVISRNSNTVLPADFAIFTANPERYYYPKIFNKSSPGSSAFCFGFLIQMTGD